jgi:hypothetical protein
MRNMISCVALFALAALAAAKNFQGEVKHQVHETKSYSPPAQVYHGDYKGQV